MTAPVCDSCREPWEEGHRCTTGADLAKEREAAKLTKAEVARRMGIKPQYLGRIEEQASPTPDVKARYRAALDK